MAAKCFHCSSVNRIHFLQAGCSRRSFRKESVGFGDGSAQNARILQNVVKREGTRQGDRVQADQKRSHSPNHEIGLGHLLRVGAMQFKHLRDEIFRPVLRSSRLMIGEDYLPELLDAPPRFPQAAVVEK